MIQKAQARKKIDTIEFVKTQYFCASQDTINKVKRHPTDYKKIFVNHMSDKNLVSRISKELLQHNNKKTNNPILK